MIRFTLFGGGASKKTAPSISPQAPPEEIAPTPQQAEPDPNAKQVLIVDDDPVFLTATRIKLQSAGFHVRTAKEASEAIAALGEKPADAILMDITFPADVCNGGMGSWDGFQIMSWLRGNPSAKGARFIMVSNSNSPADRQRAEQLGAVAYFQKPVDHQKLIAAVNGTN